MTVPDTRVAPYDPAYETAVARANPTGRPLLRGWLLTGLVSAGFALAALVLTAYYGATFGVVAFPLGLLFAALPLGIVIPTFLWLDRFEAEPKKYLITAFLWGALIAALVAALFNTGALIVFESATDQTSARSATAVAIAPLVEESLKGLFVLLVWRLRRREFDGLTDGLVYGGVTAAGFAFTENIQYLAHAFTEGGPEMFAGTFLARGLLSPFAHPMFTILTGAGIGVAATSRTWLPKVAAPVIGWTLAVLAHGAWNLSAVSGAQGFVAGYALVGFPLFLAFLALVLWARAREGRLIAQYLHPYVDAGWLSRGEVAMLSQMRHRREANAWAKLNGGAQALRAMRAFQDSASELALLRKRMSHSAADDHALATERILLDSLTARRREFTGQALV
ncbi:MULTISPECIES: PrsW family intramembrane metalloprotease [unclassified Janibacter]|uniref:PrsW family intramembrane metalloprotease n=1 Tax=unclassified Janibacter TaxID=2649294 RepID=UPI003CFD599C